MFEFILLLQLHEAKSYSSIRCLLDCGVIDALQLLFNVSLRNKEEKSCTNFAQRETKLKP